jgi:predicted membrane protein (TIGR00267 family)
MEFLERSVRQLREYNEIAGISEIARRYFAMNAFDGVLTIIGVLMGNFTAGVRTPAVVISTGLATSVAMGVSGLWGAYLTETAERKRGLDDLSNQTLTDLTDTRIGRAARAAVIIVAVVDGIAPALAASVVLLPFFLSGLLADITVSYYLSLALAMATLFALGAFLGRVAKTSLVVSGLKMIAAGAVAIVLSYLLDAA